MIRSIRASALAAIHAFAAATLWPASGAAGSLVATRVIPAGAVIGPGDVAMSEREVSGGVAAPEAAIGQEARVMIHTGSSILSASLRPPALVERNGRVEMRFARGLLFIRAEGRALDRGAMGERIRVMNLGSRAIVSAVVTAAGVVSVAP